MKLCLQPKCEGYSPNVHKTKSSSMHNAQCTRVTVLVAVYNAERWLETCLDSLRSQSLQEIQVVCVDDASTDSSLSILETYTAEDNRFEVIHLTENGGQAVARNVGLQQARGKYVCFLDSDDWLSATALEEAWRVFEANEQTDCVLFDVVYCEADGREKAHYPMETFEVISGREAFEQSLTWAIHGIYMVRTDLHKRLPYDDSCRAYSDDNTTRLHYLQSHEVRTCRGIYYYRQHEASVTHALGLQRFDYLKANMSMKKTLEAIGADAHIINIYERERWLNVVGLYYFYYENRERLPEADRHEGLQRIRQAWESIETWRLPRGLRCKFGYWPLKGHWQLFRRQEEIYFSLRLVKNIIKRFFV